MGVLDDSYTKVLLHLDGVDASTTFIDESGKTWTAHGTGQIDVAQSKFGGASGLFNGGGNYITTPTSSDFDFGTGAYTIDTWIRISSLSAVSRLFSSSGEYGHLITINTNGSIKYELGQNGAAWRMSITSASSTIAINNWYHFAVVREGTGANETKMYVGGVEKVTGTYSDNSADGNTAGIYLATIGWGTTATYYGWIDEFRLSKGIARWTAGFTPPTAAYGHVPKVMMVM